MVVYQLQGMMRYAHDGIQRFIPAISEKILLRAGI